MPSKYKEIITSAKRTVFADPHEVAEIFNQWLQALKENDFQVYATLNGLSDRKNDREQGLDAVLCCVAITDIAMIDAASELIDDENEFAQFANDYLSMVKWPDEIRDFTLCFIDREYTGKHKAQLLKIAGGAA